MKWKLLMICVVCSTGRLQAQPSSPFTNAASFADHVSKKFSSDHQRFEFVYDWICNNISYDKDSALYFNWSAPYDVKIESTLRRKKGVCENYASLLVDIASRLQIPAYVVHGYPAKRTGSIDDSHAWVAVKINQQWWLCDPTWDAMSPGNRKYFLSAPQSFIETHTPFDPIWQLLDEPLYSHADSIAAFLRLDSLQQYQASQKRIEQSKQKNNMLRNWESMNNMNIAIIAGEKDEKLYNDAVKSYNNALKHYNDFIRFRNNQFHPATSNAALSKMLSAIPGLLQDAKENLGKLGTIRENFQYDPSDLLMQIKQLESKTENQEKFLAAYINADETARIKLLQGN